MSSGHTMRESITWLAESNPHWNRTEKKACLVHIYPYGPNLGQRYQLAEDPLLMGRDDDCHIQIEDHTVSRWHARIILCTGGFRVLDLNSTNGTYVNQMRVGNAVLMDGDYLQIGNCIFRFLAGGNVENRYHEEIYRLTIIDALTNIHNRRYFFDFLERELVRSNRHHRPLSLIMFDIDCFKALNDRLGHLAGDYALRALAEVLKEEIRRDELFARYGGEEFTVILSEADHAGAMKMAERIRSRVEQHQFCFEDQPFSLTISLGVATVKGDTATTYEQLVREADNRLREAKLRGRNAVVGEEALAETVQ